MAAFGTHFTSSTQTTTCPYCGVGCGVKMQCDSTLKVSDGQEVIEQTTQLSALEGDATHPANFGKLCVKGSHLLDTTTNDDKLLYPSINGARSSWDDALNQISEHIKTCVEQYGPDSVAFYLSGQLLTEDYYVANKLMKGFIGSANVDTNSRLCMSSAVAAYKRAFGADAVPCCYEDLETTDLLVLIGSNAAWTHPVLFQRMQKALQEDVNKKMVVIDPRVTATSQSADLHLAIKPGTDVWIYNGLLAYLLKQDYCDEQYIIEHTQGFDTCCENLAEYSVKAVAKAADVSEEDLISFYSMFANAPSAISFYSMGVNQSSSGVDKANSIINCHLATGKIGQQGSGPFSITGQPNAMGGREVGGLANMLAAHMDIENEAHNSLVQRFWQAPNMANKNGRKAVDMFDDMAAGKIKFVWIMGTNPVVSMPNRKKIEAALNQCELVVVSDIVQQNDTIAFADILLPASGWSEKDGTVTNSERRISRQRGILPLQAECKHDWQIVCELAAKLGHAEAFAYQHSSEIFAEHARLSGFENKGQRDFDISGLSNLSLQEFNQLKPIQWPVNAANPKGTKRLFTDHQYYTLTGQANFIAVDAKLPEQTTDAKFPFVVNTGRMRDQWHTMTRTGSAKALSEHTQQAEVHMHPLDAKAADIQTGDLIAIRSQLCENDPVIVPVQISNTVRRGELFLPIHWSKTNSSHAALANLLSSSNDPISGQPELKHAAINFEKLTVHESAALLINKTLIASDAKLSEYQVRINQGDNWLFYLHRVSKGSQALDTAQELVDQVSKRLSSMASANHLIWLGKTTQRRAIVQGKIGFANNKRMAHLVCIHGGNSAVLNELMQPEFSQGCLSNNESLLDATSDAEQHQLLSATFPTEYKQGKVICSCFNVRKKTIEEAIASGIDSVEGLGKNLKCGTNCGSCKSELAGLISIAEPTAKTEEYEQQAITTLNNAAPILEYTK